jgi:hypothetical protein
MGMDVSVVAITTGIFLRKRGMDRVDYEKGAR